MKKPLRAAVVGVGRMGRHHARLYGELEDCELVAVVDKDINRAREIAAQHGGEAFACVSDVKGDLDAVCAGGKAASAGYGKRPATS